MSIRPVRGSALSANGDLSSGERLTLSWKGTGPPEDSSRTKWGVGGTVALTVRTIASLRGPRPLALSATTPRVFYNTTRI